ncbi:MAG: 50S ribosomal protein L13 [Candidatus Yanofskybacteria bacterium]|nr:50S ribosomal protein L13 [Candidatus Yanofskybacteria bacterium]
MSEKQTYTIDATGQTPGRLATQIAVLLRGKQKPDFVPYKEGEDEVIVENASKMRFTGRKLKQKTYYHHTGYLGGLKEKKLEKLFEESPAEVLKIAVYGMLPKNKLRSRQIKRLKIKA